MSSWRQLLLKVHPDKSDDPDATERTQELNSAKERVLACIAGREQLEQTLQREMQAAREACAARLEVVRQREVERRRALRQRLADREKVMGPIRDAYFKRKDEMRAAMYK